MSGLSVRNFIIYCAIPSTVLSQLFGLPSPPSLPLPTPPIPPFLSLPSPPSLPLPTPPIPPFLPLPSPPSLPFLPAPPNLPLPTMSRATANLPSSDTFLSWVFNVTTSEVGNLVNNFNFRSVEPDHIKFLLYTRSRNNSEIVHLQPDNLDLVDPSEPVKILVHGWQAGGDDEANKNLAEAYHRRGNYNVISVDWSEHSKKLYQHASSSSKTIGDVIGEFVIKITAKDPEKFLDNIHIIGHSLGGHMAGFAGKRVHNRTSLKIGRITGLDVAAPMFEIPRRRSADSRLSKDDAKFVDVIHTNAGFLGITGSVGTVDFYVENGGPLQPGCFNLLNIFDSLACSHLKSHEYFTNSVFGKKYEAVFCPNSLQYLILFCLGNRRIVMGEDTPHDSAGNFYLEADSAQPYNFDRFSRS